MRARTCSASASATASRGPAAAVDGRAVADRRVPRKATSTGCCCCCCSRADAVCGRGDASRPKSAADLIYGEDSASEADVAERTKRAEWSLEGGDGRMILTSLLWTFAMFQAARDQWDAYPTDTAALEAQPWAASATGGAAEAGKGPEPYDIISPSSGAGDARGGGEGEKE